MFERFFLNDMELHHRTVYASLFSSITSVTELVLYKGYALVAI